LIKKSIVAYINLAKQKSLPVSIDEKGKKLLKGLRGFDSKTGGKYYTTFP
jgi:hypothetical protein